MYYFFGYLIIANLCAFGICGVDKKRAIKGRRRIPEKALLLACLFGGAWGFQIGMLAFRHKTKHLKFKVLVPLLSLVWLAITIVAGINFGAVSIK